MTEEFQGFGEGAQQFFKNLAHNNTKEWFKAHEERYDAEVREPALAFIRALGPRLAESYPAIRFGTQRNGAGSLMRIHRDVRFSSDKRPYKENLGIIFWLGEGKKVERPCFYFHVDAGRAFFYGGQHMFPKEVLGRYREAVDDAKRGPELEGILADLDRAGLPLMEEPAYKRVPRGFDREHSREHLMRLAGLGVGVDLESAALHRADLVERCAEYAERVRPLQEWLDRIN